MHHPGVPLTGDGPIVAPPLGQKKDPFGERESELLNDPGTVHRYQDFSIQHSFATSHQESWVEEGSSQRRPGLHVDSPGNHLGDVKFSSSSPLSTLLPP